MADSVGAPIRCTQNPTMGEEWRRGWHPEIIPPKGNEENALVVGAGPAGLECAMQLARRGYQVTLAEASGEPGGRALRESKLPGLGAWARVADYRLHDLRQRANVQIFTQSRLGADEVTELDIPNVFVATGAHWRKDGIGRSTLRTPPAIDASATIFSPDDIMAGTALPDGRVVVYDDDHAYIAGVVAEKLAQDGHKVIFVTPESLVSSFTTLTLEQHRIQARLLELGVEIICNHTLAAVASGQVRITCGFTERMQEVTCNSTVLVTERHRETALYNALKE